MHDIHSIFTKFKEDFPQVYAEHESMGKEIHENSGPLDERVRWLLKIAISGASRHWISLETHIKKAQQAGLSDAEIKHALLLLIPTTGFPSFMEAYNVYKNLK
jgi:alkylhydroperoxidase/carboxymuconolactone decarboxylase family protein YurZ